MAVIHPPDPFLTDLTDIPLQFGSLEISTQTRDELRQPFGILLVKIAVEHVVFTLMPHHRFKLIANTSLVQLVERFANQLERSRVELLSLIRRIRVPIEGNRRPTDRRLDDGDRELSLWPDTSSKRHFRTERRQRLQWYPTFGSLIAISKDVREKNVALRFVRTFEVRVVVDAICVCIRSDHVGLTREEEHSRELLSNDEFRRHEVGHCQRQDCHDHFANVQIHGVPLSTILRRLRDRGDY